MAANHQLTEGALRNIMNGENVVDPIMQVLGSKRIASTSADKERYRLLLSDGKNLISFAMLTTQINDKIVNGELADNTIIKVKRYITSAINNTVKGNKRVLVILEMETLVPGENVGKIGNPIALSDSEIASEEKPTNGMNGHAGLKPSTSSSAIVVRPSNVDMNMSLQDHLTHPISSLSPYQNKWVIKARVSNKSSIRKWSNSRGEGQLFSMDLVDESGEIRCTAFRDLVDKFYDMIQVDKVYYFSKCQLKVANKQFSNLNNDYEMTFTNDTIVEECHDAEIAIPQTKFNFTGIENIANLAVGAVIDVIGVCKTTSDVMSFTSKSSGKELKKREIMIVDQSNNGVNLTLWGDDAEKFDGSSQPVMAIKGAIVREFSNSKNLSIFSSSLLKINPDIPEAHRLKGWFDNGGIQQTVNNISRSGTSGSLQTDWLSFKQVQELRPDKDEKPIYYQVKGTVLLFRSENCLYKSCPVEECKKKLVDLDNGLYSCEKCHQQVSNFKYRLMGLINVGDWSGNHWINTFGTESETVLGKTADELGQEAESNPESLAENADKANFKQFMIKARAKGDTWSDEYRLRSVAVKVEPVNYKEYNSYLISRINQLLTE